MIKPNLKNKINTTLTTVLLAAIVTFGIASCQESGQNENNVSTEDGSITTITEQEVLDAQKSWGEGIVNIGEVYSEDGDYKNAAIQHINNFYNYDEGSVLFKPTLASEKQFRTDFEGALSYFIGDDENYSEDKGFAINPWSNVRWENIGTKINGNMAVAMGNYFFTPADGGDEVKVEYSFAYTKNEEGELKIILHGSHIPYSPQNE